MRTADRDAALTWEMMMSTVASKRENVPQKVRVAVAFMLEQRADLQSAALHAGISTAELRRSMGKPAVRRFMLEQRQVAIEIFCAGSPAALTKVRDTSENGMAVVASIKAGEQLRVGAIEAEAQAQRRAPGLQIVVLQNDGSQRVAFQPPQPRPMLSIEGAAVPATPEAVPAIPPDADVE